MKTTTTAVSNRAQAQAAQPAQPAATVTTAAATAEPPGAPMTVTLSPPTAALVRWGAKTLRVFPAAVVEGALFGRLEAVQACYAQEGWGDDAFLWFMRDVTAALIEDDVRAEYAGPPGRGAARPAGGGGPGGGRPAPAPPALPGERRGESSGASPAAATGQTTATGSAVADSARRVTLDFSAEAYGLLEVFREYDGHASIEALIRHELARGVQCLADALRGDDQRMDTLFTAPAAAG